MQYLISIVMTYYNRRSQIIKTLQSIELSSYSNIEIIVVDDASDDDQRINDLINRFNRKIYLYRVEPKDKTWINPCIPFNIGLKKAQGEIVVLQNSECLHYGDVLNYVYNRLNDSSYISLPCYSLSKEKTEAIGDVGRMSLDRIIRPLSKTSEASKKKDPDRWYNHPILRPNAFHFTSAIYNRTLQKVGYFDERFASGFCYDDDEFINRVRKNNLMVQIPDPNENIFVIHQWHSGGTSALKSRYIQEKENNRKLYLDIINS